MLIIAKGRPIEIRCYAIAADGNKMTVQEGENVLFFLISSGVIVGADYITDEVDKHGEPYFRILIEKWYTLDKLTPGAYSIKLKIGERKMRLTDVFSIDRNKKNDNTGLQEGDKVVIRLTVKETPTGTITWAEDITVPGTLECIRVNGSNYYMDDRSIELPDYPSRLDQLEGDEGHRLMTDAEKDQLLHLLSLMPAEASENNKVADKAYVDERIRVAGPRYRGTNTTAVYLNTFMRWANGLEHDLNDFVFWQRQDEFGNIYLEKYAFNGEDWIYEYKIIGTQFTSEQWAAINSGISHSKIEEIEEALSRVPTEESLAGKLDNTPTGAPNRPIYIKETETEGRGEAEVIDSLDLPGDIHTQQNVEADGGMSAKGIADLNIIDGSGGTGTVTTIEVDGHYYEAENGNVVFPMASTSQAGAVQLSDNLTSTENDKAATIKALHDSNLVIETDIDELREDIGDIEEKLDNKLDNTPTGNHNLPIYIKEEEVEDEETHEKKTIRHAVVIDALRVPGYIESTAGGVSAGGIATLSLSRGGGNGTVTQVNLGMVEYLPENGIILLPAYPAALSELADDSGHRLVSDELINRWNAIYYVVPSAAYLTGNELADKAFVNSSVNTATANFKGNYNIVSDLSLDYDATTSAIATALNSVTMSPAPDKNDYCFATRPTSNADPTQKKEVLRYKYDSDNQTWSYEYTLNNSGYTSDQWAAINSTITSSLVSAYSAHIAITSGNPHGVQILADGTGGDADKIRTTNGNYIIVPFATKAQKDSDGNTITSTYATKATIEALNLSDTAEIGKYVSKVDQSDGQISVTRAAFNPSVTWTGGTSDGPTLKITVGGADSSALAVPSASADASGIVTTGAQTFAGAKTFAALLTASVGMDATIGNIQALAGGVSAGGIADLGMGGGGGVGTVTAVQIGSATPILPENGIVTLPAYPVIPTNISAFTNDVGYITGITSAMVTTALGYTPFNNDSFTQANIKSTLGISNWALAASKPSYAFSEITDTASDSQIPTLAISKISGLQTALDSKLATSLKGAANGLAELDANGLVPSSQLPSYVDDVLEYASKSAFPATGTSGKIYVAIDTNLTYRWSGSAYTEISPSLALGETSSTAYRGDRGKTAYDHATDASRLTTAKSSGFYKFSTTAEGHIASVTAVAASDLTGLLGTTYVTAISWDSTNNKLAWSKGGTAQTAITIGYATNANYAATAGSAPASDVYAWAKASTKPSYTLSEISSRYQSLIDWGGPNIVGSVSPLEVATIDDLGHNKFAFASAATITVQYSRDGGSTWTAYGTDAARRSLVTLSQGFSLGDRTGSSNTINDKIRVILNANRAGGNIYTKLRRLLLYISTNGSGGCTVKVEHRTIANYNNNVDTWSEIGTYGLSGWSGWNSIPCDVTFGGSSDQTSQSAQVRLTFGVTSVSSTYGNFILYAIRGIGFPLWTSPSTMASSGHLYSYDISQNAAFPAGVSATSFTENGTALSSKYLGINANAVSATKATNDSDGNAINTTYLKINTVKSKGTNVKPIYFDASGVPQVITGLSVPNSVEALGGVAAGGINNLSVSGGTGGLTQIKVNNVALADSSGIVSIPVGTGLDVNSQNGTISLSSTYQSYIGHGETAYNNQSNYLPLSGGTLSNPNFQSQLTIKRDSGWDAAIKYENNNGYLGGMGFSYKGFPFVTFDNGTTEYEIYHAGNYLAKPVTIEQASSVKYYAISGLWSGNNTFIFATRAGEAYFVFCQRNDSSYIPKVMRFFNTYSKITAFKYWGQTLYVQIAAYSNDVTITQIGGAGTTITFSEVSSTTFNNATSVTINQVSYT